jgi:hypothetical protein
VSRKSNGIKVLPVQKRTEGEWTSRKFGFKWQGTGNRGQEWPAALVFVHTSIVRSGREMICKRDEKSFLPVVRLAFAVSHGPIIGRWGTRRKLKNGQLRFVVSQRQWSVNSGQFAGSGFVVSQV